MKRARFQGVRQSLIFHWKMYLAAALGAAMLVSLAPRLSWAAAPALLWIVVSIAVSHYVYDRSPLYAMDWLRDCLPQNPRAWVLLHAGLDETSGAIKAMFPGSRGKVLDIFDPAEMTEPSIARARASSRTWPRASAGLHDAEPSEPADYRDLPVPTGTVDAALLLLSAHELRTDQARGALFDELRRVLAPAGRVVVAEHLRDWANFAAFGPGFLHFHSRDAWLRAFARARLAIQSEFAITPFVRVFVLRRSL